MVDPSSLPERELAQGQVLGKYRVLRKVGEGGFGRVYEAEVLEGGQRVALKVGRSARHEGRMAREARLAARLTSPHSVRVLGVERLEDGSPLVVMEFLEGISLREYLAMRGRVEPALALEWARQLAEALKEAHSLGLVHRDVKPSNLFLVGSDSRRALKLLDFGLVRASGGCEDTSVTGSEVVLGSPAYMSPEQIRSGNVTHRSDIWSFGVVLYEMLTARRPFQAASSAGLLAAIAADPPAPWPRANVEFAPGLERVVERCLRKKPEERFENVDELLGALGTAGRQTPPAQDAAEPITATLPAGVPAGRRAGRSRTGVVLAAAVLAGALWFRHSHDESLAASPPAPPSALASGAGPTRPVAYLLRSSPHRPSKVVPSAAPPLRSPPSRPAPSAEASVSRAPRGPLRKERDAGIPQGAFFASPDF